MNEENNLSNQSRASDLLISIELLKLVQELDVKVERYRGDVESLREKMNSVEDKLSIIIDEIEQSKKSWWTKMVDFFS